MTPSTKIETRRLLRATARDYLENRRGYRLVPVVAPGRSPEAYFRCSGSDGTVEVSIRTAKNRRVAFRRTANGWKTVEKSDYVLIASFRNEEEKEIDLYFMDSDTVVEFANAAYSALDAKKRKSKGSFPVWLSLDEVSSGPKAAGSGMIENAIDHISVLLNCSKAPKDTILEKEDLDGSSAALEILNLKEAIATKLGFSVKNLEISVKITL